MHSAKEATITQARLKQHLEYDPETGSFTWRLKKGKRGAGQKAGWLRKGYRLICIDGRQYEAHHLAWLYMTGELPREIDHRDLDRDNNRWGNLRPATRSQNHQNKRVRRDSTTQLKGALAGRGGKSFYSRIQVDGKKIWLGYFKTAEAAHSAYCSAAEKHFGAFARS